MDFWACDKAAQYGRSAGQRNPGHLMVKNEIEKKRAGVSVPPLRAYSKWPNFLPLGSTS
jgi:hypothetical protein